MNNWKNFQFLSSRGSKAENKVSAHPTFLKRMIKLSKNLVGRRGFFFFFFFEKSTEETKVVGEKVQQCNNVRGNNFFFVFIF